MCIPVLKLSIWDSYIGKIKGNRMPFYLVGEGEGDGAHALDKRMHILYA